MFQELKFMHVILLGALAVAIIATILFTIATKGKQKD
jgi:hypothetical protein